MVARVVDYLRSRSTGSLLAVRAGTGGGPSVDRNKTGTKPEPVRYYADSGEGPGEWLGLGAAELGLAGAVADDDFTSVLAGRHPRTGERLLGASGSAGRHRLKVGTPTRHGDNGEALYSVQDAAAALGLRPIEVQALLDAGRTAAVEVLFHGLAGRPAPVAHAGAHLVPTVDAEGRWWVAEPELGRFAASTPRLPTHIIESSGPADEWLPLGDAARMLGTSSAYLRSRAAYWVMHQDRIEHVVANGGAPSVAWLVAERHNGRWRVRRREVVAFARRRQAPAVRVAYDVTLTTESPSACSACSDHPRRRQR